MQRKSPIPAILFVFVVALLLLGESFLPGRLLLPLTPDDFPAWQVGTDATDLQPHPSPNYNMSDVVHLLVPGLATTDRAFDRGDLPLWDPGQALGVPHLHQVHYGVLYPPAWIPLVLGLQGLGVLAFFHMLVAGFGMAYYLRGLGRTAVACAAGALCFAGSAWMLARLQSFPVAGAAVWLPWVVGGLERAAAGGGRRHGAVAAAATALSFLAGFPQVSLWIVALAVFIELIRALVRRRGGRPLRVSLTWNLGALVLGIVMATPQLLPTLDYMSSESMRAEQSAEAIASDGLEWPLLWQLIVRERYATGGIPGLHPLAVEALEQGRRPGAVNLAEVSMGIGVLGLMLAVVSMMFGRSWRTRVMTLVVLGVLGLLLFPGVLEAAAAVIPLLKFGSPKRLLLLVSFALAVLAAGGIDLVCGARMRVTVVAWALSIVVLALSVVAATSVPSAGEDWEIDMWAKDIAAHFEAEGVTEQDVFAMVPRETFRVASTRAVNSALAAAVVAIFAVVLFRPRPDATVEGWKTRARTAPFLLVIVMAAEVLAGGWPLLRAAEAVDVTPDPQALGPYNVPRLVKEARSAGRTGEPPLRVARLGNDTPWLRPNMAGLFGLHDVQAYAPMAPRRTCQLLAALEPGLVLTGSSIYAFDDPATLELPAVDMLGVRVVLTGRPELPAGFREEAVVGTARVLVNEEALPRAYTVPYDGGQVVPDEVVRLLWLAKGDFDPVGTVLLDVEAVPELTAEQRVAGERAAAERAAEAAAMPEPVPDDVDDDLPEEPFDDEFVEFDETDDAPEPPAPMVPVGPGRGVIVDSYAPGAVRLRLPPGEPSLLVFSETWHSGWEATVAGRDTPVWKANHAVMAVAVPDAAETVVELSFEPGEVTLALVIGVLAWLGWIAMIWWPRRPPRARPLRAPELRGGPRGPVDLEQTLDDLGATGEWSQRPVSGAPIHQKHEKRP